MTPKIQPELQAAAQAKFAQGLALHQQGQLAQAEALYSEALKLNPAHADAWHLMGVAAAQTKRSEQAAEWIGNAIEIDSRQAAMYNNLGNALRDLKQYHAALDNYDKAVALNPDYAEAYSNRGAIRYDLEQYRAALDNYDKALTLKPDYAEAYFNRGNALRELSQFQAAVENYDKAIGLKPSYAEAYFNRGNTLRELSRFQAALESYDKAITLKPGYAEAWLNRGVALRDLKRHPAAIENFKCAIAVDPNLALAHLNLGHALQDLRRHQEAAVAYGAALAIDPGLKYGLGFKVSAQLNLCDWSSYADDTRRIRAGVRAGKLVDTAFPFLSISDSASEQQACAKAYMADKYSAAMSPVWKGGRYSHDKIRIAYVSADFREQPLAFLMTGVFERHDRSRFEVYGISLLPENQTPIGQRVKAAFDRFIDVSQKTDEEAAQLLRDLEIDIAVDLMGLTKDCRPGLFARRAAPIQINYLGYPATMGADFIDYIIADAFVMPPEAQPHYSEKVAYLPDCFQANDDKRFTGHARPPRAKYGLPEEGFVFCSLNVSCKIAPTFFDIWMRLLKKIPGSVLWLLGNEAIQKNLRAEASERGVDPTRLIFAPRVAYEEHLTRFACADLFLDTLPFNAGTTASDALWMGLPLLTCAGEAFAARMAGSLLTAMGVPELITENLADYESRALELATHPEKLAIIKAKLARHKTTCPLFDTGRFTRHLESAYVTMIDRHRQELPPESFAVTALNDAELWHRKGLILNAQGDKPGAITALNEALKTKPDFAQACFDLACVLEEAGSLPVAIKTYQYLLKIAPAHKEGRARLAALQDVFQKMLARFGEGASYCNRGEFENAVRAFRQALAIHSRVPDVWSNLGLALYHLRQFGEAREALLAALALQPGHVEALNTLGNLYQVTGDYAQADATYRRLIAVKPDYFRVWVNLGKLRMKSGDDAGAVEAFAAARKLDPRHAEVLAELTYRLHHLCRWGEAEAVKAELIETLATTPQSASPFIVTLYGSPALQLENAKRWSSRQFPRALPHDARRALPADARQDGMLRIGYLSADFHHHATSFLISELFERHDRSRFGVYAYSCGQADDGPERKRIERAVRNFRDISALDNRAAAALIARDGIDILVDLKGYTHHERMDLMAQRPAPIQMHYLGYPGTTGANFIDYFIADHIAAPKGAEKFFSERLIRLPHSYQINDRKRPLPKDSSPRAAHGLPAEGFVFCGFNRSYKIMPTVYDIWMRLLKAAPGSVLWLYEPGGETAANLKREAIARGVDGGRIVIAATAPQAIHLQRYRHADLFLDTFPVCGHTTASDALWCGVPVVTVKGESFAGRVAASLLCAVGLPELAVKDAAEYESLALALARDKKRLSGLKKHLEKGRAQFPLFDSEATTRALEAAYRRAAEIHRAGLMPQAFDVSL